MYISTPSLRVCVCLCVCVCVCIRGLCMSLSYAVMKQQREDFTHQIILFPSRLIVLCQWRIYLCSELGPKNKKQNKKEEERMKSYFSCVLIRDVSTQVGAFCCFCNWFVVWDFVSTAFLLTTPFLPPPLPLCMHIPFPNHSAAPPPHSLQFHVLPYCVFSSCETEFFCTWSSTITEE